jgi:subtilisin family serine protease
MGDTAGRHTSHTLSASSNTRWWCRGGGAGVHVYVLDTGINPTHIEFDGRMGVGYDTIGQDDSPHDCHGHGTHCAGVALGATYGVAPHAFVHALRILDCQGKGSSVNVVTALDWVARHAVRPAVVSMSIGGGYSQALNAAVESLFDLGVVIVAAAGNENDAACGHSPASSVKAFTVGASDRNDRRAVFSNYGECVNIMAPGVEITVRAMMVTCNGSPGRGSRRMREVGSGSGSSGGQAVILFGVAVRAERMAFNRHIVDGPVRHEHGHSNGRGGDGALSGDSSRREPARRMGRAPGRECGREAVRPPGLAQQAASGAEFRRRLRRERGARAAPRLPGVCVDSVRRVQ